MGENGVDTTQAETDDLQRAASTADSTANNVDGQRMALLGLVNDATARNVWDGTAVVAFRNAHDAWDAGVLRLVTALRELGDGTLTTANTYLATDADVSSGMASVAGQSAFGGALER